MRREIKRIEPELWDFDRDPGIAGWYDQDAPFRGGEVLSETACGSVASYKEKEEKEEKGGREKKREEREKRKEKKREKKRIGEKGKRKGREEGERGGERERGGEGENG